MDTIMLAGGRVITPAGVVSDGVVAVAGGRIAEVKAGVTPA